MLASINRLKSGESFERVKRLGKLFQTEDLGIVIFRRGDTKPSKFGFVVSTKIAKKAVDRNRIKRVLSEIVRLNLDKFPSGLDVLFLVKKSIFLKTMEKIRDQIEIFISKNKL